MDAGSRVLHLGDLPALDDINKLLASDDSPVLAGFLLRVMRQLQLRARARGIYIYALTSSLAASFARNFI